VEMPVSLRHWLGVVALLDEHLMILGRLVVLFSQLFIKFI